MVGAYLCVDGLEINAAVLLTALAVSEAMEGLLEDLVECLCRILNG